MFLRMFKPFIGIVFEVKKPEKPPSFNKKVGFTFAALILYLMMLNIPVAGITTDPNQPDPFFALRAILASQRGSLAELGIGPIVTAGMILQLLVGSKIIKVDFNDEEDKLLYTGAQKMMSILMTIFEAIAYIAGGAYGTEIQKSLQTQAVVILQLTMAGAAIMLLDEIVQKGYGLGSGISLFIAASVSFRVVRGSFDITSVNACPNIQTPDSNCLYPSGAILFFAQSIARNNIYQGLWHPEINNSSDMFNLLATVIIFAVVIYFESMRIEIPVQHADHRMPARYPIKFLYVSNIPVILVSALFANVYLISNVLRSNYSNDPGTMGTITRFFGVWDTPEGSNQQVPIAGLASFTTPPRGIQGVATHPLQAMGYLILMVIFSAIFAMIWVETAGMSSRDVARQLIDADMQIPGFRRNEVIIEKYLQQYIPYAAFLGGVFIGLLAALADFMGAIGSGTGILLTTGIIRQYYEILAKERLAELNPGVAGLFGLT